MQNFILKSKNETLKLIESKKEVYFFGSGVVAEKTLSNLDATRKISGTINLVYINLQNQKQLFHINSLSFLKLIYQQH